MVFVYVIICVGDRVLERVVAETKMPFPVAVNAVEELAAVSYPELY
jgi:hypothetical protein